MAAQRPVSRRSLTTRYYPCETQEKARYIALLLSISMTNLPDYSHLFLFNHCRLQRVTESTGTRALLGAGLPAVVKHLTVSKPLCTLSVAMPPTVREIDTSNTSIHSSVLCRSELSFCGRRAFHCMRLNICLDGCVFKFISQALLFIVLITILYQWPTILSAILLLIPRPKETVSSMHLSYVSCTYSNRWIDCCHLQLRRLPI